MQMFPREESLNSAKSMPSSTEAVLEACGGGIVNTPYVAYPSFPSHLLVYLSQAVEFLFCAVAVSSPPTDQMMSLNSSPLRHSLLSSV